MKATSIIILLALCTAAQCQTYNLVKNSSFEEYTVCPDSLHRKENPTFWYQCSNITSSYLHACGNHTRAGVPYNQIKGNNYQPARTGQAYIYLDCSISNIRQYLQTQLRDSLIPGHCYYTSFYTNLPNPMAYACNNIGILFTKNAVYVDTITTPYGVIPANPQVVGYGNPIVTDTVGWTKISAIFTATGGEKFITLGNFKDDNNTQIKFVNSSGSIPAGYIFEDVSVLPLDSFCLKADAGKDVNIALGDSAFIGSYTNGIDSIRWYINGTTLVDSIRPGFYVKPITPGSYMYVVEQTVNGCFTKDTVYINVLLPLKFTAFQASPTPPKEGLSKPAVSLEWTTLNEVNVSHFNIQRSENSVAPAGQQDVPFKTIGIVKANNGSINEYKFTDNNPTRNQKQETWFYRIQAIDNDGKTTYSTTKQIKPNEKQETSNVLIYPNPAKNYFTINSKEKIKEVKIFDSYGRMVLRDCFVPRNDSQTLNTIALNTKQLNKGLYIVQIITSKGEIKNEKLLIE